MLALKSSSSTERSLCRLSMIYIFITLLQSLSFAIEDSSLLRNSGLKAMHTPSKADAGFQSPTLMLIEDTAECGVDVGCFNTNQDLAVKFRQTDDNTGVEFQIKCQTTEGWCSLGFANTKTMSPASVIDCLRFANGDTGVRMSYNGPGRTENNVPLNDITLANYITVLNTSYVGGVLTCNFVRLFDANGNTNNDNIYSLNTPYYLLLGKGALADQTSAQKLEHGQDPAESPNKVDVREIVDVGAASKLPLLQAHGTLMITAWVLLVSTSIILARYFKTAWPGDKLCTTAVWFAVHRSLMLLGLICTAIGFILVFVYEDGKYSTFKPADSYYNLHPPLGIAVMVLVIANPVISLFRCDPGAAKRPIFNWLHWLVGTTCHILAIITVFTGVKIGENAKNFVNSAVFYLLIGFAAFHVVIEIVLTAHKFVGDIERGTKSDNERAENKNSAWGLKFRYAVLAVYGVVVTGLWLAMIVLIGAGIV